MSDIFISYAREDKGRVEILATALQAHGWSVWWDPHIPTGKRFDQVIEEALTEAKCIIVVWSKQSISSPYVRAEANEGIDRQVLLPVMIEEVKIPLVFRQIQTALLVDWHGSAKDPEFEKLVKDIEVILGMPATAPIMSATEPKTAADSSVASRKSTGKLRGFISKYVVTIRSSLSSTLKILALVSSAALLIVLAVWIYSALANRGPVSTNVNLATPTPQPSPTAPPQNDVVIRNFSELVNHIKVTSVAFFQGECSDTRPEESQLHTVIDQAKLSHTRWFVELAFPRPSRDIDFVLGVRFYDLYGTPRGRMTKAKAYVKPESVNSWHCSLAGLDGGRILAKGSYNAVVYVGQYSNKLSKVGAARIEVY